MDIENRKTVLDDSASIYKRTSEAERKEALKNLPFRQKIGYYSDYYLAGTVAFIAAAVFIVYILYTTVINPSKEVLSIAFLNRVYISSTEELSEALEEYIGMERKKDYVGVKYYDTTDYQTNMAYVTIMGAGQLDLIICTPEDFQNQAAAGSLADLRELLPEETYSRLGGRMVTGQAVEVDIDGTVKSIGEELEYGIDITDSAAIKQYAAAVPDRIILCAFAAPQNMENTLKAIDFFLR